MPSLKIFVDFALPENALARLKEATQDHTLLFPSNPSTSVLAQADTDPQFYTADVVFGQPDPAEVSKAESLKWIHISSSGYTRYDTPDFKQTLQSRKIPFTNSAAVYAASCAEHVIAFMLCQSRRIPQGLASRADHQSPDWLTIRRGSVSLRGQSLLIVGFGSIGKQIATLLKPFGMNITAYRRSPKGDEGLPTVSEKQLPEALASADHIINILPDSPSTQNFFDAATLAACKPGSVFYNIGRGTTVDQEALVETLKSGHFKEAWLDVTEPEPLDDSHPLRQLDNCFITPHTAGGHANETLTCVNHFIKNLERFTSGQPLLDRVF